MDAGRAACLCCGRTRGLGMEADDSVCADDDDVLGGHLSMSACSVLSILLTGAKPATTLLRPMLLAFLAKA